MLYYPGMALKKDFSGVLTGKECLQMNITPVNNMKSDFSGLSFLKTKEQKEEGDTFTPGSIDLDLRDQLAKIGQQKSNSGLLQKIGEKLGLTKPGNPDQISMTDPIRTIQYADNHGRLSHVVLSLSSMYSGKAREQMLDMYQNLFTKLEPDTKFSIIVGGEREKRNINKIIKDNNVPNPERIKFINSSGFPTIWSRDMMVTAFSPDYPSEKFIINPSPIHARDKHIPDLLDKSDDSVKVFHKTGLVTDGGDVMSNRNESVIGYASLKHTATNMERFIKDYPDFGKWSSDFYINTMNGDKKDLNSRKMYEDLSRRLFEEYFGKPVTVVGKDDPDTPEIETPAAFHQDMVLTPVDDKTFFLGDPVLFDKMVDEMPENERKKAEEQLSEVVGHKIDFNGRKNALKWLGSNENNTANFESYRKILEDKGYEVVRLPFKFGGSTGMPTFTYNNCIMENFDKDGKQVKRVFLPTVGVDYFDNYAVKEYEKKGFEVHTIPMGHVSKLLGTIRCTTNWLERTEKA
jgi:arginine deiminase